MLFSPEVKVHTVTSVVTFGADEVLLRHVSTKLRLTQTNQQDSHVAILFCPIITRVGSDVEAAIRLVSGNNNVILVLMHHTRDGNYSAAGTKWSDIYPNVMLDVHILYHESMPGLLMCSQNTDAVNQIQAVLSKYSNNSYAGGVWMIWSPFAVICVFVLMLVSLVDWLNLLVLMVIMLVVVLSNYNNSSWHSFPVIWKFFVLFVMMILLMSLMYHWMYHSAPETN